MKILVECSLSTCKNKIERYIKNDKKLFFCNIKCKANWQKEEKIISKETRKKMSIANSGKNNGMYGKNHTNNSKQKISKNNKIYRKEHPEVLFEIGKANRGKKFSKERINKMHGHRSKESYSRVKTKEEKKLIGEKSKAKFTIEFKNKIRIIKEKNGTIIKLEDKNDFNLYHKFSQWICGMFDIVNNEIEIKLLNEFGVFNIKNNRNGVVRDHKFSIKSGFDCKVFPELLRHPVNCQVMTHSKNSKKSCFNDSLSLEELFNKIINYNRQWDEQNICLHLINMFNNGKRYNKEEYINKYYKVIKNG